MLKEIDYTVFIDKYKEKIVKRIKKQNIPGLSISLITKDDFIWIEGFGFIDITKKQPVNENTLFSLQSTTKTVTSVALLLAVQKKLLQLDDPIINYYPEFYVNSRHGKDEYKKITFRHLLSHKSGLPREARIGGCFSRKLGSWEEHIKSINNAWLNHPVGEVFSYSNIGMDLVPYLLEKITGKSYPDYLQEVLGEPLGIKYHWSIDEVYNYANTAKGYLNGFEAHKLDGLAFGCGGAFLSIKDQAKFVKFLLNKGSFNGKMILKPELFEQLRKIEGLSGDGFGTIVINKYGIKFYGHPGGGFGYSSEMFWLPEQNIGLALFHNSEYVEMRQLAMELIADILKAKGLPMLEEKFPHKDEPIIELEKDKLQRFEGFYNNSWMEIYVKYSRNNLYLTLENQKTKLNAHSEIAYSSKPGYGLIFHLDDKNKPTGYTQYHSKIGLVSSKFLGKPIEKLPPTKDEWKKYVGLYFYKYYYTEYYFTALFLDKKGFLQLDNSRLYPFDGLSNIFYRDSGITIEFENDNSFYNNNLLYTKMDNPVEFYQEILDKNPKHRALLDWVIRSVISSLKKLGRVDEANQISNMNLKK
ncbi:MAG: beta-lactamase family protein [Asgard group archaeon]|nr:beta-lactamase family protein [Asgard group archaeon]